ILVRHAAETTPRPRRHGAAEGCALVVYAALNGSGDERGAPRADARGVRRDVVGVDDGGRRRWHAPVSRGECAPPCEDSRLVQWRRDAQAPRRVAIETEAYFSGEVAAALGGGESRIGRRKSRVGDGLLRQGWRWGIE